MQVMWHPVVKTVNGQQKEVKEQRCPYCFSRNLKVTDYRTSESNEKRYGDFYFDLKCKKCGGRCSSIVDIPVDGDVGRKPKGSGSN